jgi:uncharacterized OB-fold protein
MGFMDSVKGFAEKVGDTVERGAKSVSDSSKKIAEKNRVKREIASLENDINNAYYAIGKKYFELNADKPGEEYAETIELIKSKTERADKFKIVLAAMDEKQTCTGCGAEVSRGQKFCDKCGAKIEEIEIPIIEGYNDVQPEPEAETVEVTAEEVPQEAAQRFCSNCGEAIASGSNFCEKCGTKIE